ncbi:NAD-dependent epimerase/dehydratase family protein [Chondromyces crocatus]|uniref:Epimerase n=1 Tax=Chondromyces crocatus TaxID=52 RepID=A0A0K1EIA7_CHOCO|nr:NAD(P)-dependent oxidoreductase [Chondromyces crocatus]AKT40585.1 epimerase [Chondromyces crocatus]
MGRPLLITGSEGLIGRALGQSLVASGFEIRGLDLRARAGIGQGDVRVLETVRERMRDCVGVVHLAAVSRVIWGEQDPQGCWETNVGGTGNVLTAALGAQHRPWVLFASSREVYGQPRDVPVSEDAPLAPLNVYGRSKVMGERLLEEVREAGLRTAVVRLSNVYGSPEDHPDRVVPAFARAALLRGQLRVDGAGNTFDFTHLSDTVRGLVGLVAALEGGEGKLPPVHLVTGIPTTLGALARLAVTLAGTGAEVVEAAPRDFDVSHFHGSPQRAKEILGWEAQVSIEAGLAKLIEAFRGPCRQLGTMHHGRRG